MAYLPTSYSSYSSFLPTGSLSNWASGALGVAPNIGGTLGGIGGSVFGGPIGGLVGGALGNVVGDIFGFGSKKPEQFHLFTSFDPVTGKILVNDTNVNGDANQQIRDALASYYLGGLSPVNDLLGKLGIEGAAGPLSIGAFRGAVAYGGPDIYGQIKEPTPYERGHDLMRLGTTLGAPGGRTDVPDDAYYGQAYSALLDDYFNRSLTGAGMEWDQVYDTLGIDNRPETNSLSGLLQAMQPQQPGGDTSIPGYGMGTGALSSLAMQPGPAGASAPARHMGTSPLARTAQGQQASSQLSYW